MSSLSNRETGLIRRAARKGLISEQQAESMLGRVQSQIDASAVLAEAGIPMEQISNLRAEQLSNTIPAVFDNYQVEGIVGKGGMSLVLKATHVVSGETVAIKVLQPRLLENERTHQRFMREIETIRNVTSPFIIRCFGCGYANENPYLALEYLPKGDVANWMERRGGRLREDDALGIAANVALGLQAIADAKLVHRDIKPGNIFLAEDGTAKIADLGLVKSDDDQTALTLVGKVVGTPGYMSPEQAQGRHTLDIRSDLFSLGATLYHMISGQQPFRGAEPSTVMRSLIKKPHQPIDDLISGLLPGTAAIIDHLMAKNPAKRYQRPADVADDIATLLQERAQVDIPARQRARRQTSELNSEALTPLPAHVKPQSEEDTGSRFTVVLPWWRRLIVRLFGR